MSDHALVSPSGFFRIELCPGSLAAEDGEPNESSRYAAHGSAAHDLAARYLQDCVDNENPRPLSSYEGEEIEADGYTFTVDEEMIDAVQAYADKVMSRDVELLVERKVCHGPALGLSEDEAFGTSDAIGIGPDTICVDDFKFGKGVRVFADNNSQMKCYALGALRAYGLAYDFQTVTMAIHQPRIGHYDEWSCTVDELERWAAEEGRLVALEALDLLRLRRKGLDEYLQHLVPGEKQCRFCNAAHNCPALAEDVGEITGAADDSDFSDMTHVEVKTNASLAVSMHHVDLVERWCKAIRAEIERRLLHGDTVPGYKLVMGKQGNRAWTDKAEAEAKLRSYRLPVDEIYTRKVISPTAAESLLKKTSPRRWADLQALITRAPGKPSVAPDSDGRPPVAPLVTDTDFQDLTQPSALQHPFRS